MLIAVKVVVFVVIVFALAWEAFKAYVSGLAHSSRRAGPPGPLFTATPSRNLSRKAEPVNLGERVQLARTASRKHCSAEPMFIVTC